MDRADHLNVLVVFSSNVKSGPFIFEIHRAFITEQIEAIKRWNVTFNVFPIKGRGINGYLQSARRLRQYLQNTDFDLLHAHGGHCGLVGLFQKNLPVVVTYHGSDINVRTLNLISSLVSLFSSWNIFVSSGLYRRCLVKSKKYSIIPCGVDLDVFQPIEKADARRLLGLAPRGRFILFSSAFDVPVKNSSLAREAISRLKKPAVLMELKNRPRHEVSLLLNACDLLLMTSIHEGSPQIIKEAMACNCPIVSTDVGDVREVIRDTPGCFLAEGNASDMAVKIEAVFFLDCRTNGRENIRHLDNRKISRDVLNIYQNIVAFRRH